jgi:type II secretory pathway predicted ATPase ExeA
MRIDLMPLSVTDTIDYLRFCLQHAGAPQQLFPDNAAVRLHEITGGMIADLAVAAESALVLTASHGLDEVTPAIVEAAEERISRAA